MINQGLVILLQFLFILYYRYLRYIYNKIQRQKKEAEKVLNMLGSVHRTNSNLEDDKQSMKILKSQRRTIFVLMILVVILDINDFLTNENSFFLGLFSGVIIATCIVGLFVNFSLSKRIGTRIKKTLD